jgi:hypothetical protein
VSALCDHQVIWMQRPLMSDDAMARATRHFDLIVARITLNKVFHVPPGPSMKNTAGAFEKTLYSIVSYAYFVLY